ncbi:hypothetical protein IEQ34_002895 [Dendrobium chrysotoxum]|uniref:Uncharacterized protein n=1 Tax=Dendrobium chrysotoxum TaxID=161865 RepID=A0AAV7HG36_DENCH|nr:hypothetical protein IEQ34_002895 [Dendrobium chrysotoxum]
MARAIEVALCSKHHWLCQWNIFKNVSSKVWCFNSNDKVKGCFYNCLRKYDSEEMLEKMGLK